VRAPLLLLAASVTLIAAVTLTPTEADGWYNPPTCLICGGRAVADAIVNVLLFIPFGIALSSHPRLSGRRYALAFLLSPLIEITQFFIEGRDANVGDVLFNTAGLAFGLIIARQLPFWLGSTQQVAARLSLLAAGCTVGVLIGTGFLLTPTFPAASYVAQHKPAYGGVERYRAEVRSVRLGQQSLPDGTIVDRRLAQDFLHGGTSLHLQADRAAPSKRLSGLFAVSDVHMYEIFLVGFRGQDLVLRYRTQSRRLRLDSPDVVWHGALNSTDVGERFDALFAREAEGFCMSIADARRCHLGHSIGSGWSFFVDLKRLPPSFSGLLNCLWVAALLIPVGYWSRLNKESLVAIGIVACAMILVPPVTFLIPSRAVEFLGAALGLVTGIALSRFFRPMGTPNSG
jgi:hypothetical protein